jgi:prepilin-type N-terminal cleavage/methylation domain-containing protein
MFKFFRRLGNSKGFSLAEMVVASAVMGAVATGGSVTYGRYMRSNQEMDLKDVMSTLRKETETALTSPQNLVRSLGQNENAEFKSCFGSALNNAQADGVQTSRESSITQSRAVAKNCSATDAGKFYSLVLVSSTGTVLAGGTRSANGERSTTAQRILTGRGQTCSAAVNDDRCEVEVTTAFRAICPPQAPGQPPAATCETPSTVEFFFTVRQLSTGTFFKRNIKFPGFNNMINADGSTRDRADAIRVRALDFMRPDFYQCDTGQTFKGFDKNGKIQCGFQENPCARKGDEFKNWIFLGMNEDGTVNCKKPLEGENCATAENPLRVLRGVLPGGQLDCVDPKISNQGCKDGEVLVRFDEVGDPVCVASVLGKVCPKDQFLAGYDNQGVARCVDMKTPSGILFNVPGQKCGHQHGNCRYGSANKPGPPWVPKCPEDTFTVKIQYNGPRCCATCGWVGQWWCDDLVAICSPFTNAKWK